MKINRSFTLLTILLMITLSSISSSQNPINLSALNFASLPTYQLTSLPTYQLTNLPAYQLTSLWSAVDSLIALGQPRSALEIVEKIYQSAKSEKNDPQIIKSIIYRIRLNAEFQENFLEKSIADLKKEIAVAGQPAKQILQSILAEVYWKYYQNNEYRFRDRTLVAQNQSDSIATWDLATIYNTIARTYLFSLENQDTLKKTPIGKFLTIIECDAFGEKKKDDEVALATKFLPTLYDFLAGRAVEFFTSQETAKIIPAQRFEVDQKWYFDPTLNFIRNPTIIPADTASPASFAIRLFRNLAAFHFEDKERCAIIAIELKRLDFVHEESVMADKDSLYLDALKKFEQNEIASHWSTSVSYTLADFYNNQGQRYQPLVSNQHKWDIRSAVEICDKAIKRFPGSEGAKNCGILKKSIRIPALQITAEKAVPVGKPSLALIRYKNLNELNFRLVKTDPEIFNEKSGTLDQEAMIKYLTALKAEKSWLLILPNEGDYQSHSLETKIPEVPSGSYILLASSSSEFTGEDQVFTYTTFWSTQISYISRRMENGSMGYFMLDRVTGLPLKNVRTEAWVKNYNYQERQYRNTKLADYISDNRGSVLIPPVDKDGRNSNLYLKIWYNDDFFITGNFYQYPVNRSPERTFLQTMFYTDRAIYRPGQTIYFKGIILEKSGEKSKIKSGYSTKVVFTDVNGQKISEQTLTTNEFGSVHGSFIAPQDRLPGAMTISNESGSAQVLIESYKLPTFDVTCDPLEGNYKLGEKLNVTGKALAYAGNAIAGAAVKYRVVRTARFPWIERFWYWPVPSSPEIEITNGTTSTDAEGKFGIGFTAIPDLTLGKETKPVYAFTIFADVTDLNGETQSVQQAVSVGYTSLIIGISLPEKVDLATDSVFAISATNLNGRPTPTQISATLSLLRQPDRPFKPREWERPDRNIMTKDEFHASFPYDIYGNEDNPATWIAEKIIFERTLNTRTDSI
ncbi:MAG: MG2 domain-containing protein, partial [Bacteroidota bacterium]